MATSGVGGGGGAAAAAGCGRIGAAAGDHCTASTARPNDCCILQLSARPLMAGDGTGWDYSLAGAGGDGETLKHTKYVLVLRYT